MGFAKGLKNGPIQWEHYILTTAVTLAGLYIVGAGLAGTAYNYFKIDPKVDSWKYLAIQFIPFVTALLALFSCLHFIHKQKILLSITSRKSFSIKRFFFAFGVYLTIQLILLSISILGGAPIEFRWSAESFFPLLLVCLLVLPIQTAFEDIFYRGYLFQGLVNSLGKVWLSILVLGVVFGTAHMGNPEFAKLGNGIVFYYIISGLFLGLLAHLDDGLELGMGYHFANNLFGALMLTNNWQVFQTDALFIDNSPAHFGWENWLALLTIQPGLLILFYKVYRWNNPIEKIKE